MSPKVSIIVPVYNVEKYLKRCVDSLVGQTLKDIEIILVDDGSPDGCPKMCDDFAAADSRIKVVHKPNGGLGSARNAGLEVAQGEYVAFVDSDDYVLAETYATFVKKAEKYALDTVFGGYVYHFPNGRQEDRALTDMLCVSKDVANFIDGMLTDDNIVVSVWTSIYRRSIIEDNNLRFVSEREYLSEDIMFNIDFLVRCRSVGSVPKAFYHYCYNGDSLTQSFKPEKIVSSFRLFETIVQRLEQHGYAELKDSACRYLLDLTVGVLKSMIKSCLSMNEKIRLSREMFAYERWTSISQLVSSHSQVKLQKRVLLFLIKHNMYYSCYFLFRLYYMIKA